MQTKKHQAIGKFLIIIGAFLSGIILTVVVSAAYDAANVKERANNMVSDIVANAPTDADPEDLKLYYSAIRTNLQSILDVDIGSLIAVINEVDTQLAALSNQVPSNSGSPNPTNTLACTGIYPKDDPNASFWPNGGFVVGPSPSDQTNKVWKYKYAGTCMFDCNTGYSYNPTKNLCEKDTYAWACGFVIGGGPTADPAKCNTNTVGEYNAATNCLCSLSGGPKGNPISFSPAVGVFDMAAPKTLTSRLDNVKPENILLCQEIISHPNPNVEKSEGLCKNAQYYKPFPGSSGWKYVNGGYDITVPYDAAIFGAAGIKTRFFIKDKMTNQVAVYEISVKNSGSTGSNPSPAPAPTKNIVCTGNAPKDNVVKVTMPQFAGVGDWENTVWKYQYGGSCSWSCAKGYKVNANKTACETPAPGTGVSITIVDKNGNPLSGVALSLIYNPNASEDGWTTNANGKIELFPEVSYNAAVLGLNKSGYIIYSATGCSKRSGVSGTLGKEPYSYCDGTPLTPGTKIDIVMMPLPSNFGSFTFSPQQGTFNVSGGSSQVITTKISGASIADTLTCLEVLSHPNVPSAVNQGYCANQSNYVAFTGNNDWSWTPENGGTWNGNIQYNPIVYGAAGIKVRIFMKNKATNQVGSFDMSIYQ